MYSGAINQIISQGGRRIPVITNFFQLNESPADHVGLYFIEFIPVVDPSNRGLRDILIENAGGRISTVIGKFTKAGMNLTAKIIREEPFAVTAQGYNPGESYILNIRLVGTIGSSNIETYRMYSNSMLKKMLQKIGLIQLTKLPKYYDKRQTVQVTQHNLEIWRGYTASFSHHLTEMLLNVDFSSKIIRHVSVLQYMTEIRANTKPDRLRQALESELIGKTVMAKYGNYKCHRIDGLALNESPLNTFDGPTGLTTYRDYYITQYNIEIQDFRQPLLISTTERGAKVIRLIPELCDLTGISEDMRKDYRAMNDIAVHTRLQPQDRLEVGITLAHRLAREAEDISEQYSMSINPEPVVLDAIRFPPEIIKLGETEREDVEIDDRAGFNIKNSIYKPKEIAYWAILSTNKDLEERDKLVRAITAKAQQIGVIMGSPYQLEYTPQNLQNIISVLNNPPGGRPAPVIAVILVPAPLKDIYHNIKESAALSSAVPTQVILSSSFKNPKRVDSIISKLVVQIAAKTGSELWALCPCSGIPIKTMVIGIDIFHDTVSKAKSVMGFVSSINPTFTKYYNTAKVQERVGQEIVGSVSICLKEALGAFYEATKKRFLPDLIVVFRDGVADSQIKAVKEFEVDGMKSVIKSFEGYRPGFVYIVMNKKTNAKFFVNSPRGIINPLHGTVITDVVVPDVDSFYLVSHGVTQGMASPTLYRIIEKILPDEDIDTIVFARLAYKLCYMYYNWTGGIKIPAPTMMAHKLAYMVGQSIHDDYLQDLKVLPWFL
ncbi:unnamed protein product [Blepharisma stoltei]|uniref:Uncharacterized protein n=1 Tax=Blepharisma stoltei TaxID=1481888 RepID=A0AAU9J4W6_9CILI|nr:unnamed protein product [Blepharisma stoltei]